MLDLHVTTSAHLKEWMVSHGAVPEKIQVAYTNVDCEAWAPDPLTRAITRMELGLSDATPAILFVGRVCADKQPKVMVETAVRLREAGLEFAMLVAGDGPDLDWVRTYVREQKLIDQVHVLGPVPYGRIERLMQASDIFFLPSRWEGIAVTLFEALACGLPVVAANVGGQSELVTSNCGVLVSAAGTEEQTRAYYDALANLINDPYRRKTMGRAGRARVEASFRLSQMGDQVHDLLSQTIDQNNAERSPLVSLSLGRASAQQTVESLQLMELVDQLRGAQVWSEEQRVGWERACRDQESVINELRSWVNELQVALARSEAERAVPAQLLPVAVRRGVTSIPARTIGASRVWLRRRLHRLLDGRQYT
jgi:hypothetical protein